MNDKMKEPWEAENAVTEKQVPVRVYGETEFWFASVKVMGIIGLLVMAMVLIFGGGPKHELLGFHY